MTAADPRHSGMIDWKPPESWWRIDTLDAHTAGEPFRVVLGGFPEPRGDTMLERRRYVSRHYDHLRKAVMLEPRGHADMYGCLVTPPATSDGHVGVLFMHNAGWSTMCGHGIIGLTAVLAETGYFESCGQPDPLMIDSPAGRVDARIADDADGARRVVFQNVASFIVDMDADVEVQGMGSVTYDLAFGGAFYAFVEAESIGLRCVPEDMQALIEAGKRIKHAIAAGRAIVHPEDDELGFLYGVIFTGPAEQEGRHSRHVCIFADGEVDRSPTGTGVSARLAILHARGDAISGETVTIESIIGSCFAGRIAAQTSVEGISAIVPEVSGRAFITGRHTFYIDPRDPYREGFLLR